ncbi:hypothetical protein GCM10027598_58840 [Amycolatopsis oliviviridis]|uniref:HTH luxR-type domain-containing protein n=1 Tax=Amycolatopsis oliviviridis TaxID=1471590 RepID=A0ABQ3LZZ8_9PSEU|nr:LuxR family transcriptional regulator [Amycolatopsis oliviviridis]GHH28516.1 hypothetical protein GCM10017790_59490 [Amycolatopsis oliviviridis]
MTRQGEVLVGQRTELAVLVEERSMPGVTLVYGLPGSGKSALLANAAHVIGERGNPVLAVPSRSDRPDWDLFGVTEVLAAVRDRYEDFVADTRLPETIETVSRLCAEDAYSDPWKRFCLLHALGTLFTQLSRTGRVTIVLDDVDRLPDPVPMVASIHRAGHAVIAACRTTSAECPDLLDGTETHTVELGPLTLEDTSLLLRRRLNAPVSPIAEQALRTALGPLWGNPAAVLSTAAELRESGRFEVVHGLVCLRAKEKPITLPVGHSYFANLVPFGDVGRRLVALATSPAGLYAEDLRLLVDGGRPTMPVGRMADELVRAGLLDCEPTGRIRCQVPAMGNTVAREETDEAHRRLRSEIVLRLTGTGETLGSGREDITRHIAAAGNDLPRRAEFVGPLRSAESSLAADSPERTDHLYAAWWHQGEGPGRADRQTELVRHLVRIADYARLAAFTAEAVHGEPDAGEREELGFAAVLASVHLGCPVPAAVRGTLSRDAVSAAAFGLSDRWFDGGRIGPDEVADHLLPVWRRISFAAPRPGRRFGHGGHLDAWLADACAVRDLVPILRAVLGRDYRVPVSGPLADYHRALTGHAEGRWEEALEAVRELELQENADELCRERARLLAAEMHGWRGEHRQAAAWLATVPEDGGFPLLKAWVDAGLTHHSGAVREAFEIGRRAYRNHPGTRDEVGAARLLLRLAWFANRLGAELRRAVVDFAEEWHGLRGSRRSYELMTLVRGLAAGDETGIRVTEKLVRRRGDRHGLVLLSEAAAARESGCPQRWLREIYETTRPGEQSRPLAPEKDTTAGPDDHGQLSEIELEIIGLVRGGRTNRQIARAVRISEKTVEKHLTRLYTKAGCRTRYGLATSGLARHPDAVGA